MSTLKILKFPDIGRVEACTKTVANSWDCDVMGDYNMELMLVELVNYSGEFDFEQDLILQEFYLTLLKALMLHREICNGFD